MADPDLLAIIEQCKRFNAPLPKEVQEEPELRQSLTIFLRMFYDLTHERQERFSGVGRIPRKVIRDYANDYGFSRELAEETIFYIQRMDSAFIKKIQE